MPTIKLQNGNVLIKNGKASCSCCDAPKTCCMYPAAELGSSYQAEDLPDAVTVNWPERFTGSMSKNESGYSGDGATLEIVEVDGNLVWQLSDSNGVETLGSCLIGGLVEDQFADCYKFTVEAYSENGWCGIDDPPFLCEQAESSFEVTLERTGLCTWEGSFFFATPNFTNTNGDNFVDILNFGYSNETITALLRYDQSTQAFVLSHQDQGASDPTVIPYFKDDPSSSPAGDYAGITVTETTCP
jgi:hypothetical protein